MSDYDSGNTGLVQESKTVSWFSKIAGHARSVFWPVEPQEYKFVLLMIAHFFLVVISYGIVRNVKDSMVVTNKMMGAKQTQFLKMFVVIPAAILTTLAYKKACKRFSKGVVYMMFLALLNAVFMFFAFIGYPYMNSLCTDMSKTITETSFIVNSLPKFIATPIINLGNNILTLVGSWPFSLFYAASEMWGAVIIFAFWEFANSVVTMSKAKLFYPMFSIYSNLFAYFAMSFYATKAAAMTNKIKMMSTIAQEREIAAFFQLVIIAISVASCLIAIIDMYCRDMVTRYKFSFLQENINLNLIKEKAKKALSKEQWKDFLNPYKMNSDRWTVLLITIMIIAYGFCAGIQDVQVKQIIEEKSKNNIDYTMIQAWLQKYSFLATFIMSLCGGVLLRFGWFKCAIITPACIFIIGTLLFSVSIFAPSETYLLFILGGLQNVFSKSTKYALFDSTREMSYISVKDTETRTLGKNFADIVGGKIGKGSGAIVNVLLVACFGNLTNINAKIIGCVCFVIICFAWLIAVYFLGKQMSETNDKKSDDKKSEDEASNQSVKSDRPSKRLDDKPQH